jgi:hypothetical protein
VSGNLERRCRRALASLGIRNDPVHYLTLFRLGEASSGMCLCDLREHMEPCLDAENVRFAEQEIYDIDRTTYFPLRMVDQEVKLLKDKQPAESGADALRAYAGAGWIFLHRNARDLSNQFIDHRCLFLDVSKLIRNQRFRSRLRTCVLSLDPLPQLIITPPHGEGDALAGLVSELLCERGCPAPRRVYAYNPETDIDSTTLAAIRKVGADQALMVLDDVRITGD